MSSTLLNQVEQSIIHHKKLVELGDALERLKSNRDFRKLILEGYFEKEAIRLVHFKASPQAQSDEMQKAVELQMNAIGALSQYFNTIRVQADMARKSIEQDEATREELLAEGLN